MDRELAYIHLRGKNKTTLLTSHKVYMLRNIAMFARYRYVDRLTKKQQRALDMIRILDKDTPVDGLGFWCVGMYGERRFVIDC